MQKSEKFNYLWKMTVLSFLIISVGYMGWQFRDFTLESTKCHNQPFLWGANEVVEKTKGIDVMDCSCKLYNKNGFRKESFYYFSNEGENLPRLMPFQKKPPLNLTFQNNETQIN